MSRLLRFARNDKKGLAKIVWVGIDSSLTLLAMTLLSNSLCLGFGAQCLVFSNHVYIFDVLHIDALHESGDA